MVFYRKYRPQTVNELDTAVIRQNLGAVLSSGKIPHALLFTGPRGLGKTSAARIVAKSINCLNNAYSKLASPTGGRHMANSDDKKTINHKPSAISEFEPCNECATCVSITEGRNLDVLEIDAASNRGIDEIRDLREKIKLSPTGSRYKIYIIDEVHMLTTEAFNALLKTLEEPPSHAVFILCTTEAHKLPPTIISRCLRFDFKRASKEDLIRSLERVAKGEKLKVGKEVLEEIAKGSEGSFRDAVKILEQATFSDRDITADQIKKILGETENLKPEILLKLLSANDVRGAVGEIDRIVEAGENLRVYTEKILALLHSALMVKIGVNEEDVDSEVLLEKEELIKLIELFSRAYGELKSAVIPQLPLELAAVEWCEMTTGALRSGVDSDKFSNASVPVVASGDLGIRPDVMSGSRENLLRDTPHRAPRDGKGEDIAQLWPQIIEATKEYNHTIAGVLRGCRPQNFDGRILTIETFYKFHRDKLNEPKIREILDKAVVKILGENVGLKCVLGKRGPV